MNTASRSLFHCLPVAHADSFIINIAIASMHKLTSRILDVSNAFQNTNVPLNRDYGQFCLQCMNVIQGTKPDGRQWNRLLDTVVTILEYKKSTIDHGIYIKFFDDGTVSYLTVSTDDVLSTTNNENEFTELTIVFK